MAKVVKQVVATAYDLNMQAKTCTPYEVTLDLIPGQFIEILTSRQLTRATRPGGKEFHEWIIKVDGNVEKIVSTLAELQELQLAVCAHNLDVVEVLYA